MRKWLYFLPFLLFSAAHAKEKSVVISNLKGMASAYEDSNLREDLVHNAQNVWFDKDLGVTQAYGYSRDNAVSMGSQPVQGWQYIDTNGLEYSIIISSNLMRSTKGDGTYTTIISTLDSNTAYDCVSALGRFICTSTLSSFYLNGSLSGGNLIVVDSTPTFPLGSMIAKHQNRIWVSGVIANPSILYGSAFLSADNWTLGINATDPVQFTWGLNDGDKITGIYSAANKLYVGKRNSFWNLIGASQNDFTQANISPTIGCIQNRSMRDKEGNLYWLSRRGIEKLYLAADQIFFPVFSEPIKDQVDNLIAGLETTNKSFSDASQADFSQGVSTYVSLTDFPNTVSRSSPSIKTVDILTNDESLPLHSKTINALAGDREMVAQSFRCDFSSGCNLANAKIALFSHFGRPNAALQISLRPSDVVFSTRPSYSSVITTTVFVADSKTYGQTTLHGIPTTLTWSNPETWGDLTTVFTSTGALQNNTTYWLVATTTAIAPDIYSQFTIELSSQVDPYPSGFVYSRSGSNGAENLEKQDLYFHITFSSSQFVSSVKDLGATVSQFLNFSANISLSGGIVHIYTRSDSDSTAILSDPWIVQTNNSVPGAAASRYFQYRFDLESPAINNYPQISSAKLNWVGTKGKQQVASWVFDDRYFLSGSTNSAATVTNETVIVADKFDNFTRLNGFNAFSFWEAFGNKYYGTSTSNGSDTGMVFNISGNFLDQDGRPTISLLETKGYCGDSACSNMEEWNKIYVKTRNPGFSGGNLACSYQLNQDGAYGSLGNISLTETGGLINSKVMIPFGSGGTVGNSIKFKFMNTQLSQPFNFLGAEIFFADRLPD